MQRGRPQSLLSARPAIVADLLKANLDALNYIKSSPAKAEQVANGELAAYTGKPLSSTVLDPAFKEITFTANEPSLGVLLSAGQDQTDMPSTIAIMTVILILGIAVDAGFGVANREIRKRWGLS